VSPLLAQVEQVGDELAAAMVGTGPRRISLVGAAGSGKATAMRHAQQSLGHEVPTILLEASADDIAPVNLLNTLGAGLTAVGYAVPATADSQRDPFVDLSERSASALAEGSADGLVIMLNGAEQLRRLASGGGTPGRHASHVLGLLHTHAPRLALTDTVRRNDETTVVGLDANDLNEWFSDGDAWGPLAQSALAVRDRGASWRRLPALSARLLVGLTHMDVSLDAPPATPHLAARLLADALASHRTTRPTWAAWQLIASLRGPLSTIASAILLEDVPRDVSLDPLLAHCLLFQHSGWHMHPVLRQVALSPPQIAATRTLPDDLLRQAGRRMVEHFRAEVLRSAEAGDLHGSAVAEAARLDACALSQDEADAAGLSDEMPDPYDHIGRRIKRDPIRSRAAFDRARLIDATDATALRGLAAAEDRQGDDPAQVEQLVRNVLDLEPQDDRSHVRLVALLLATGRPEAASKAFDDAAATLSGILSEDDLINRLLLPIARTAVAAGQLQLASRAAAAARDSGSRSREAREVDRLVRALVEALEYGEFVIPERLGTRWWLHPVTLSDFDTSRRPLTRWLAARVESADDTSVTLHYADVVLVGVGDAPPSRAWTTMDRDDLRRLCLDELDSSLDGTILEIGIYGDGERVGSTVIRAPEIPIVTLPTGDLPLDRYVRRVQ
jgi:hypothetical protein